MVLNLPTVLSYTNLFYYTNKKYTNAGNIPKDDINNIYSVVYKQIITLNMVIIKYAGILQSINPVSLQYL